MQKMKYISALTGFAFLGMTGAVDATSLNIDFGFTGFVPSAVFGAASGQTGVWNDIDSFITSTGVVDTGGSATGVTITIGGNATLGTFQPTSGGASTDVNALVSDGFNAFSGTAWTVSMTGLSDGLYDVYLYDHNHPAIGTGSGALNGTSFDDINGDFFGGVFTSGVNYHLLSGVLVAGGILNANASALTSSKAGLSGMQLVSLSAVPLPAALPLYGTGLAIMGLLGWRKRRKAAV